MKKIMFLSLMLLSSALTFAQSSVLSIKDAISIYNEGLREAKHKLAELDYDFFGEDDFANHWAKNCEYSNTQHKAIKFGKGTSSVITIYSNGDDVTITVFNKAAFTILKSQIAALGYNKTDEWGGSTGNHYVVYSKEGSPNITTSDESADSDMPYNIRIGD